MLLLVCSVLLTLLLVGCSVEENETADMHDETAVVSDETADVLSEFAITQNVSGELSDEPSDATTDADDDATGQEEITDVQIRNLEKLSKVWGFVKYTHNTFITGENCWDEELLRLIPIVRFADEDAVNGILYDWFIGLGDDGYDLEFGHDFGFAGHLEEWESELNWLETFDEAILWGHHSPIDTVIESRKIYEFFSALHEDGYDLDWQTFVMMLAETFPDSVMAMSMSQDVDLRPVADLSWIDHEYLGPLAAHLLRFDGIGTMDRSAAPISINPGFATPNFSNKNHHVAMDFSNDGYRLLGLFRLWNAMKYFYPHIGILDVEWNDLLTTYIPMMLEGEDRFSYEVTLAALAHHVRDSGHLLFFGTTFFDDKFGQMAHVQLREAEGRLVVFCDDDMPHPNRTLRHLTVPNPFEIGDVILGVDGKGIDEITAEMLRFLPYPNEEKALAFLAMHGPIRARRAGNMEIVVLRDDVKLIIEVDADNLRGQAAMLHYSHELLENNIGLINPHEPFRGNTRYIMEEFADTDGIIIDLRQYPDWHFYLEMRQYLMEEPLPFAYRSTPSQTHPGMRVDAIQNQYISQSPYAFIYDRPVVLLMDERSISRPEWVIMSFRVAPNVTVIGSNSMGSNGEVSFLPLPGGITMMYTSIGVYTLDGGQTHRIGLEPDIRVDRTIQGIAEGRDEIMEAAIRFILES